MGKSYEVKQAYKNKGVTVSLRRTTYTMNHYVLDEATQAELRLLYEAGHPAVKITEDKVKPANKAAEKEK